MLRNCEIDMAGNKLFIFDQRWARAPVIPVAMIIDKDGNAAPVPGNNIPASSAAAAANPGAGASAGGANANASAQRENPPAPAPAPVPESSEQHQRQQQHAHASSSSSSSNSTPLSPTSQDALLPLQQQPVSAGASAGASASASHQQTSSASVSPLAHGHSAHGHFGAASRRASSGHEGQAGLEMTPRGGSAAHAHSTAHGHFSPQPLAGSPAAPGSWSGLNNTRDHTAAATRVGAGAGPGAGVPMTDGDDIGSAGSSPLDALRDIAVSPSSQLPGGEPSPVDGSNTNGNAGNIGESAMASASAGASTEPERTLISLRRRPSATTATNGLASALSEGVTTRSKSAAAAAAAAAVAGNHRSDNSEDESKRSFDAEGNSSHASNANATTAADVTPVPAAAAPAAAAPAAAAPAAAAPAAPAAPAPAAGGPTANLPMAAPFRLQQRIATYKWYYIHLTPMPVEGAIAPANVAGAAGAGGMRPQTMLSFYRVKRYKPVVAPTPANTSGGGSGSRAGRLAVLPGSNGVATTPSASAVAVAGASASVSGAGVSSSALATGGGVRRDREGTCFDRAAHSQLSSGIVPAVAQSPSNTTAGAGAGTGDTAESHGHGHGQGQGQAAEEEEDMCVICCLALWPDQYRGFQKQWVEVSNKPKRPRTHAHSHAGASAHGHLAAHGHSGTAAADREVTLGTPSHGHSGQSSSRPPLSAVSVAAANHNNSGGSSSSAGALSTADSYNSATFGPGPRASAVTIAAPLPVSFGEVVSVCAAAGHARMHAHCADDWLWHQAVSQVRE